MRAFYCLALNRNKGTLFALVIQITQRSLYFLDEFLSEQLEGTFINIFKIIIIWKY
jgi:hypothetical protein